MDAASNRSIDSIRDLREKVSLAPTAGQYKVYIIDEVHMLTTEAFNALLKTLEEPPSHAVFILATTEAHKLPETIVSRTQTFNFKPITISDLVAQLSHIAASENITVTPGALEIIATTARGGFRDAISMLDQLAGAKGETITETQVHDLLGYSDVEEVAALGRAIAARDTTAALKIIARLDAGGSQAGMIATQLTSLWRSVLLTASGAMLVTSDTTVKELTAVSMPRIAEIINALLEVGRSGWPQLALETTVVRLTAAPEVAAQTVTAPPAKRTAASPASKTTSPATAPAPEPSDQPAGDTPGAELWPKVLVLIKGQNNSLAALLQMYPFDFASDEITIKPRFNFHRDLFLKPTNRATIETAASKVYGRTMKISARTEEGPRAAKRAKADPTAELVSSALEILGGEVVE